MEKRKFQKQIPKTAFMINDKFSRYVFGAACIYDGLLGILYFTMPRQIYDWLGAIFPNHIAYVQFPALLLIVFAIMFFNIARDPQGNRNLFIYAILMKLSFSIVVTIHWINATITDMWTPMALVDFLFAVLFYFAYRRLTVRKMQPTV